MEKEIVSSELSERIRPKYFLIKRAELFFFAAKWEVLFMEGNIIYSYIREETVRTLTSGKPCMSQVKLSDAGRYI